jgi:hypothetical protein
LQSPTIDVERSSDIAGFRRYVRHPLLDAVARAKCWAAVEASTGLTMS